MPPLCARPVEAASHLDGSPQVRVVRAGDGFRTGVAVLRAAALVGQPAAISAGTPAAVALLSCDAHFSCCHTNYDRFWRSEQMRVAYMAVLAGRPAETARHTAAIKTKTDCAR
jgi:hypothetical protein